MVNLKQFEDLEVHSDSQFGHNVFKVKYKNLDDLSGNPGATTNAKPKNDLLDDFQEGDLVRGLDTNDEEHEGVIVHIKKDEDGENIEITIEENGEIVELRATSVHPAEGGSSPYNNGNSDFTAAEHPGDSFMDTDPAIHESSLKNIKRFSDFNGK